MSLITNLTSIDGIIEALAIKFKFDAGAGKLAVAAAFKAQLENPNAEAPAAKPKRAPAAFELYAKTIRAETKAGMPEGTKSAEVTAHLRTLWKALDDEAKAPFVAESASLRAASKPAPVASTKKIKDPNAPKRPPNAFMLFSNEHRAEVRAQHPDEKMPAIAKILGEMWKALSDEDRAPLTERATELSAAYTEAKAAYEASKPAPALPVELEAAAAAPSKKTKAPKDPNAPKRPMSGFMLFSAARRPDVRASQPEGTKMTVIAKLLGAEWKELDEAARAPFEAEALAAKEVYQRAKATYALGYRDGTIMTAEELLEAQGPPDE